MIAHVLLVAIDDAYLGGERSGRKRDRVTVRRLPDECLARFLQT